MLRETSETPILPDRDGRRDRQVVGLGSADDYVTKPFSRARLLALRAVLRRSKTINHRDAVPSKRYRFGRWELDAVRRS
jgi:DNA-binding response OmpR family regulator